MNRIKNVCVFCGSRNGFNPIYEKETYRLGQLFADHGIRLIYGGGNVGLMGAVARGALDRGGKVTGVIPAFLTSKERIGNSLDELDEAIVTDTMHERKMLMYEKADAFVALPGGIGTLEELVEQLTWAQLGQHRKPIVLADFGGFWEPFLTLLAHMKKQSFLYAMPETASLHAASASEVLTVLKGADAPWTEEEKELEVRSIF